MYWDCDMSLKKKLKMEWYYITKNIYRWFLDRVRIPFHTFVVQKSWHKKVVSNWEFWYQTDIRRFRFNVSLLLGASKDCKEGFWAYLRLLMLYPIKLERRWKV